MRRLHLTAKRYRVVASHIATCLLTAIALCVPCMIRGQSQASADSATLQGSVRDSSGHPVAGATVYLQLKDGTQSLLAHSDQTGSYRFSGLREGIYRLRAEMAGYS